MHMLCSWFNFKIAQVRTMLNYILPDAIVNGTTGPTVSGDLFNPDCNDGEDVAVEQVLPCCRPPACSTLHLYVYFVYLNDSDACR